MDLAQLPFSQTVLPISCTKKKRKGKKINKWAVPSSVHPPFPRVWCVCVNFHFSSNPNTAKKNIDQNPGGTRTSKPGCRPPPKNYQSDGEVSGFAMGEVNSTYLFHLFHQVVVTDRRGRGGGREPLNVKRERGLINCCRRVAAPFFSLFNSRILRTYMYVLPR